MNKTDSFSDKWFVEVFFVAFVALVSLPAISVAAVPAGFTEFPVVTGLSNPTAMAFPPDGRLFVCQQGGALRVIKNEALLSTPFVSITVDLCGNWIDMIDPSNGNAVTRFATSVVSQLVDLEIGPDGSLY